MWRQSEGFTLLEVLAAFVIWMIIATLLLPSLVRVNQDRNGFFHAQEARLLLAHEVEKIRVDGEPFYEKQIEKNGTTFSFIKKLNMPIPQLCIEYEDFRGRGRERCAYLSEY